MMRRARRREVSAIEAESDHQLVNVMQEHAAGRQECGHTSLETAWCPDA
jgi:hypothetical protein